MKGAATDRMGRGSRELPDSTSRWMHRDRPLFQTLFGRTEDSAKPKPCKRDAAGARQIASAAGSRTDGGHTHGAGSGPRGIRGRRDSLEFGLWRPAVGPPWPPLAPLGPPWAALGRLGPLRPIRSLPSPFRNSPATFAWRRRGRQRWAAQNKPRCRIRTAQTIVRRVCRVSSMVAM